MRRLDLRMNGRFGQWLDHQMPGRLDGIVGFRRNRMGARRRLLQRWALFPVSGRDPLRGIDPLQLSRAEHRDHENAGAAVGEIQPRAGAGRQRAERGAETAQPFEPRGSRWQQPSGELRHLAPMLIGRAEGFAASAAASAALNTLAPTGLVQRIRAPSVDHNHAGKGLAA